MDNTNAERQARWRKRRKTQAEAMANELAQAKARIAKLERTLKKAQSAQPKPPKATIMKSSPSIPKEVLEKYGLKGIHPVADLFPMMIGREFADLCFSIKERGLVNAIEVNKDALLLDGRNRLLAVARTGAKLHVHIANLEDGGQPHHRPKLAPSSSRRWPACDDRSATREDTERWRWQQSVWKEQRGKFAPFQNKRRASGQEDASQPPISQDGQRRVQERHP